MQNTFTARRISSNQVTLMVLLVTVALFVGLAAGFATGKPSTALSSAGPAAQVQTLPSSPALAQPQSPTSGWGYLRDSLTNKWYTYHYATTTSKSPVIDEIYELQGKSNGTVLNGCVPLTQIDTPVDC